MLHIELILEYFDPAVLHSTGCHSVGSPQAVGEYRPGLNLHSSSFWSNLRLVSPSEVNVKVQSQSKCQSTAAAGQARAHAHLSHT